MQLIHLQPPTLVIEVSCNEACPEMRFVLDSLHLILQLHKYMIDIVCLHVVMMAGSSPLAAAQMAALFYDLPTKKKKEEHLLIQTPLDQIKVS